MNQSEIIRQVKEFPEQLELFANKLTESQLNTPIREGAWTIRQSIHHLVDSHSHSYIRIKFALTEENPSVKAYDENQWAQLPDCMEMPIKVSLDAIRGIHGRIAYVLEHIPQKDWKRTLFQPELGKVDLLQYAERFAIHGPTHLSSLQSVVSSLE